MSKQGNSGVLALGVLVACVGGVIFLGLMTQKQSMPEIHQPGTSETPLVNRPVVVTPAPELNMPTRTTEGDRISANTTRQNPDLPDAAYPRQVTTTQRLSATIESGDRTSLAEVLGTLSQETIDQPFVAPDFVFDGLTPLSIAASYGDYAVVMGVLDRGANPDELNASGTTALMEAVQHIASTRDGAVRAILETGSAVDRATEAGETALMLASRSGNAQAISDLLEANANPNATNANGKTPLMLASESSTFDCVVLLLNGGARVEMQDATGRTASQLALERGGEAGNMIVAILVEAIGS